MSASHTNATNATRAGNGTDEPTISAIITEAGRPKSALRRSARFTWSRHVARVAGVRDSWPIRAYRQPTRGLDTNVISVTASLTGGLDRMPLRTRARGRQSAAAGHVENWTFANYTGV